MSNRAVPVHFVQLNGSIPGEKTEQEGGRQAGTITAWVKYPLQDSIFILIKPCQLAFVLWCTPTHSDVLWGGLEIWGRICEGCTTHLNVTKQMWHKWGEQVAKMSINSESARFLSIFCIQIMIAGIMRGRKTSHWRCLWMFMISWMSEWLIWFISCLLSVGLLSPEQKYSHKWTQIVKYITRHSIFLCKMSSPLKTKCDVLT